MTLKCYNKPNRKEPRHFKASDVERIARYVVRDRHTALRIIAYVLVLAGLGHFICKAARALTTYQLITKQLGAVAIGLAVQELISRVIRALSNGYISKIPFVKRLLIALAALSAYLAVVDMTTGGDVGVMGDVIGDVTDVADFLEELCDYVDELGEIVVDKVEDVVETIKG